MARKVPAFTRTTITVPTALKRRMDKVTEDVNWSALAARAFEQRLAEIATKKEKRDMTDVVQRLRASKQRAESEQYRDGLERGQKWGMDRAEWNELERITNLREELQYDSTADWNSWFALDADQAYGVDEHFAFLINPDTKGDRREAESFWHGALGYEQERLTGDFVRGFADGALEIWDAVQGEL